MDNAPREAPAERKARRATRRTADRALYKQVRALKVNKSARDPQVPGLRYVARRASDGTITAYGQLRYRHPVTDAWVAEGLGRVPSPFEVEATIAMHASAGVDEGVAFAKIRTKAREKLGLVGDGVDPKASGGAKGVTVTQAIEQHIVEPRKRPLAERTVKEYRAILKRYLGEWAKAPLRRIDGPALAKLRKDLHKDHGPDTAKMVLRLLRAAWNTARLYDSRLGEFPRLPRGATSGGDPKKSPIKPSDFAVWFATVEKAGGTRRDIWLLGIMTGLRRNDLLSIRREHVTDCTLHIPKPKGGAGKAFDLPLSDAACELVERVLRSHNSDWLWPSTKSRSGHLEDPDPVADDKFPIAWTMHDLRRMYASVAAAVVTNGYHLKALLNHALPKSDVTAGYIELSADDLRPSQQAVTDRLRKHGLPL